jgi:molybdopterin converting factor small subunit
MAITLNIPSALRSFTDNRTAVEVSGATVGEALGDFVGQYPDIRAHLFADDGGLRAFINIYVGERNIKQSGGLDTPVRDGDSLILVPAIAGGRGAAE